MTIHQQGISDLHTLLAHFHQSFRTLSVCVCVCPGEGCNSAGMAPPPPPPQYLLFCIFSSLNCMYKAVTACTKDRHTKPQDAQNKKPHLFYHYQVGHIRTPIHTQTQSIHSAALLFHKPKTCDKTGENSSWGTRHICKQGCLHTWIIHISYIIYMHIA